MNDAGGTTQLANRSGVIVVYANGVVIPRKWYSSPKILDGCTIIVNQKEQAEPFNLTQFATNWTQIISSVVTVVILSQQIGTAN